MGFIKQQPTPGSNVISKLSAGDRQLADKIEADFHSLFLESHRTQLRARAGDPVYLPAASATDLSQIIYSNHFWRSALHELAHWFIAGRQRREQRDYDYWYQPERSKAKLQRDFLAAEIKPQALEWHLCSALGQDFFVSLDSFGEDQETLHWFRTAVKDEALRRLRSELPTRAMKLVDYWLRESAQRDAYLEYWRSISLSDRLPG